MRTLVTSPTIADPRATPGAPGALTLLALGAETWDRRSRPNAPARRRWTAFARDRGRYAGRPASTV